MAKFSATLKNIQKKERISPSTRPFKSGNTWLKYKGYNSAESKDAKLMKLKGNKGIVGSSVELDKNFLQNLLNSDGATLLSDLRNAEIVDSANRIKVGSTNQG